MACKQNLTMLRNIIFELRKANKGPIKNNPMYQYIMEQSRKFNVTEQQACRAQEEMRFMGHTYLCYLRSSRLRNTINEEFHGKGERTVAETAKLVGFKLPHDPK